MTLPKNVDDLYPLSPMQHLMLLHAISSAGNGVLLNQVCYDVRGPFDGEAFRRAWDDLVARHDVLRTAFLWEGLQQPLQVVRTTVTLPYRAVDLSSTEPDARAQSLAELEREDRDAPMTLGRAPLMRCTVARLAPEHHRFVWSIHHLVVDRWSHGVLFAELRALYDAHVRGVPVRLETPTRFRDYVDWVGKQDRAAAEMFWREELAGVREPTPLAADTPTARGARFTSTRALSSESTAALRERAARARTTPASLLLSAAGLLTARRNSRDDVVLGVTVGGRPPHLSGSESIVGSFVNNLPARFTLRHDQPVDAWVRDVQRAQARRESFAHASLGDVHGWSDLPAARPLFDTLVLLNLTNDPDLAWAGLSFEPVSATLDAGYPLILGFSIEGGCLTLTLVHDESFDQAEPLLAELEAVIGSLTSASERTLVGDLVPPRLAPAGPAAVHSLRSNGNGNGKTNGRPVSLADTLLHTWRDILGIDDIGLDDDFFALGGTSLQAAQLFARVERTIGRTLPLSTLFAAGSVRALVAELDRPIPRTGALVNMRSSGTRAPLYAVPGIGGNVVGLAGLARQLGPDQPFRAFESPGLDGREDPLESIEDIADRYVGELLREREQSFHLLGICWGAAVAYEMTRQLSAQGKAPLSLTLMDPAVLLRETRRTSRPETTFIRQRLELYWDEFREGDWTDRGRMLASKAKRAAKVLTGGEALERSQTELNQVRVREANKDAITRYAPSPIVAHARIFITAERDVGSREDPRYEWVMLIHPRPEVVSISGTDSGDAISPAKVGGFASALRASLDAATVER
ncbi:MAG TPA: condensation domain-containing protein [Gemmatimonadaceae bacterium]|nr:condensation domain-containing protein [Gemmatimonadaceae bacterium]